MFLLGFHRKLTALALCKSIESALQWFQIHHRITFATMQNPAVYLSGARVSIFSTLVPRLQTVISTLNLYHAILFHANRAFPMARLNVTDVLRRITHVLKKTLTD